VKANEEEAPITIKGAPIIMEVLTMEVNTRILTVGVPPILTVGVPPILTVGEPMMLTIEEAVAKLTVAAAEMIMATVTVLLAKTKAIRAITMWYLCQGRPATALDRDAACRNALPRKDHGLVSEESAV
jgi:hypothetical protein